MLVGFRDDQAQPGGGVFLIRNSAGPSRDGMMTYDYVRAYLNDAAWMDFPGAGRAARGASPKDGRTVLRRVFFGIAGRAES